MNPTNGIWCNGASDATADNYIWRMQVILVIGVNDGNDALMSLFALCVGVYYGLSSEIYKNLQIVAISIEKVPPFKITDLMSD